MRESEMFLAADQAFTAAVNTIAVDQWDTKVPATPEWTIRQLVNHVAHNQLAVTDGAMTADANADILGDDPTAGWNEIAAKAEAQAEANTDPEKAARLAAQTGDRLLHWWDLQGALGADQTLDPKLADFCYDFMMPHADQIRESGMFGPEVTVADDAPVAAKLLAFSGRDPHVSGDDVHETTGNFRSV